MSWTDIVTAVAAAHPDPTDTRIDVAVVIRMLTRKPTDHRPLLDSFIRLLNNGATGKDPLPVGILGADELAIYINDLVDDNIDDMIQRDKVLFNRVDNMLDLRLAKDTMYRSFLLMVRSSKQPLLEFFLTEQALRVMGDSIASPDWVYRAVRMLYLGLGSMMCSVIVPFERVVFTRIDTDSRCFQQRQSKISFALYCKLATRDYPTDRLNVLGFLYYLSGLPTDEERYNLLTTVFEIADIGDLAIDRLVGADDIPQ